jgi:hypothetical protein
MFDETMTCFYKLNFPVKFLQENVDLSNFEDPKRRTFSVKTRNYITPEAFDFLCSLGVQPNLYSYMFLRKPLETSAIHTDNVGPGIKRIWAINYIWGTSSSNMAWYRPLDPTKKKDILATTAGSGYIEYQIDEVEKIEERSVSGLFLTRTDVPHSVTNYDPNNKRWSISVRAADVLYDWDRIVKTLDPYIELQ